MRTVGILIDEKLFQKMRRNRHIKNAELNLYNRAARKEGLEVVYFSLPHMNLSKRRVLAFRYSNGSYQSNWIKLPKIVYNRTATRTPNLKRKLHQLNRYTYVFNSKSRYPKYRIHRLLAKKFHNNLPHTVRYSRQNLRKMMKRYPNLYIKPQDSSFGRGIIKISRKSSSRWHVRKINGQFTVRTKKAVHEVDRIARRSSYLIQKEIPLAKYHGRPFDIRVSVQRNSGGSWQVTGMVARTAKVGSHVTNVAQGGSVMTLTPLLRQSFQHPVRVKRSIRSLSLRVSRHLGRKLPHLADLGIDIGINKRGKPFFIEVNCRYLRKGFKQAGMSQTYQRIHQMPIKYAKRVLLRRKS